MIQSYTPADMNFSELRKHELEDLLHNVLELRSHLRKLKWYAEANLRGFVKILKKLDKHQGTSIQMSYLNSHVFSLNFSKPELVEAKLLLVNAYIHELSIFDEKPASHTEKVVALTGKYLPELSRQLEKTKIRAGKDITLQLKQLVKKNNAAETLKLVSETDLSKDVVLSFLYKAVALKSFDCALVLLHSVNNLEDSSELYGRTILHKLILSQARESGSNTELVDVQPSSQFLDPATIPSSFAKISIPFSRDGKSSNDDTEDLLFILKNLLPAQRKSVIAVDEFKRTPLHYSAQHGLKDITKVLIEFMSEWGFLDRGNGFDGPEWKDSLGQTPIQLSVSGNHPKTTRAILESVSLSISNLHDSSNLLYTATKLGSSELLEILLAQNLNPNFISQELLNESCLYLAAKHQFTDCVKVLVENFADTEIAEAEFGWTPLFIACVYGNLEITKVLVEAGANKEKLDSSGWTAMEHANLRGHLTVADIAKPSVTPQYPLSKNRSVESLDKTRVNSEISSVNSNSLPSSLSSSTSISSMEEDVSLRSFPGEMKTTFGHNHLRNKCMVLVNLGSMDVRNKNPPIELFKVPYSKASLTELDTTLSLVISSNCEGKPHTIDLPIPEIQLTQSMDQFPFYTNSLDDVKIYFDIVPKYHGNKARPIGRAVALVSEHINKNRDNKMRSFFRTITIPILELSTLDVLGKLQFEYLAITPFEHPKLGIENSPTYWKTLISSRVIGHRGLGRNYPSTNSLQLGENTVESFIQAASLGASYVEFDVQLTKDFVPVIYHDYLVSETGLDIPTQAVTLEQFLDISNQEHQHIMKTSKRRARSPPVRKSRSLFEEEEEEEENDLAKRRESYSLYEDVSAMRQRLKNTRDFKLKGFKPNIRGHSIQSPVVTLEHAFKTAPKNIGFNIECKYPMLDESENEDMDAFGVEFNYWVDTCKFFFFFFLSFCLEKFCVSIY